MPLVSRARGKFMPDYTDNLSTMNAPSRPYIIPIDQNEVYASDGPVSSAQGPDRASSPAVKSMEESTSPAVVRNDTVLEAYARTVNLIRGITLTMFDQNALVVAEVAQGSVQSSSVSLSTRSNNHPNSKQAIRKMKQLAYKKVQRRNGRLAKLAVRLDMIHRQMLREFEALSDETAELVDLVRDGKGHEGENHLCDY